ncbi:MAG: winged helix-turn-helix transcriptional regulator [Maritimibacter sp.]|nr:winged helix-turn-helix transcriptional regulator [Maritimibacter sp.]
MKHLSDTFAALGDPTRLAIVERLLARGALSAGELQNVADVSAPAISRHLKVLREAGILTREIDGQRRIYSVAPAQVRAIHDWTISHKAFWTGALDRLADALGERDDIHD